MIDDLHLDTIVNAAWAPRGSQVQQPQFGAPERLEPSRWKPPEDPGQAKGGDKDDDIVDHDARVRIVCIQF
jgi:hypothetical protein